MVSDADRCAAHGSEVCEPCAYERGRDEQRESDAGIAEGYGLSAALAIAAAIRATRPGAFRVDKPSECAECLADDRVLTVAERANWHIAGHKDEGAK